MPYLDAFKYKGKLWKYNPSTGELDKYSKNNWVTVGIVHTGYRTVKDAVDYYYRSSAASSSSAPMGSSTSGASSSTHHARLQSTKLTVKPQAMVDTPMCNAYTWIEKLGGITNPAGTLPSNLHYVLVGGALSNLFLALHLRLAGSRVTVLEASSSVAGRGKHTVMKDGTKAPFGMMRFGRGEALWIALLEAFNYVLKSGFPDPGIVPTIIAYKKERTDWSSRSTPPKNFERVSNDFVDFLNNGYDRLTSWHTIQNMLQNNQNAEAKQAIQGWFTTFGRYNAGQAIRKIFKEKWSEDDFKRFDALGIGSGGFGPLNSKTFFVFMRALCNGFEDEQGSVGNYSKGKLVDASPQDVIEDLKEKAISTGVKVKMEHSVTGITKSGNQIKVSVRGKPSIMADHVIIGTTLELMRSQITGLQGFLDRNVWDAVVQHARVDATKLFALVDVSTIPEVNNPDFPLMLLSDQSSPQIYILPAKNSKYRLVLMLYGWEAVARKYDNYNEAQMLRSIEAVITSVTKGHTYEKAWAQIMANVKETCLKKWTLDPYFKTGFPMPNGGQEKFVGVLTHWFNKVVEKTGPRVHLNGDFFAGCGGWCEGGLLSALAILSAELKKAGTLYEPQYAPCNLIDARDVTY